MTEKIDQIEEVWVQCQFIRQDGSIEKYPNYEVSNLGRVKSLNYNRTGKSKVLKPNRLVDSNGTYYTARLCKDKKSYWRSVHRLILSSFDLKSYFKGAVVDHIDSNPSNNRLSNLRWVTPQENNNTLHFKEAQSKAHINHPAKSKRVKVTFLDDNRVEIFPSTQEVARTLRIPLCTVSNHITRRHGFYKKLNVLFEYI